MNKKPRKERIKDLLSQLANMSEEQRAEFSAAVPVVNPEGRVYSPRNQQLLLLQFDNPTVCGGYKQWKQHGRQVKKGSQGALIWFPVGPKDKESGEIEEAERFYTGVVFDISQTEEIQEVDNVEDLEPGFIIEKR